MTISHVYKNTIFTRLPSKNPPFHPESIKIRTYLALSPAHAATFFFNVSFCKILTPFFNRLVYESDEDAGYVSFSN